MRGGELWLIGVPQSLKGDCFLSSRTRPVRTRLKQCGGIRRPLAPQSFRHLTKVCKRRLTVNEVERVRLATNCPAVRKESCLRLNALLQNQTRLSRAPSTICREIKRNSGPGGYRASHADQLAWDRAQRPKVCKLVEHRMLARIVADKLQLEWSPEQIAGWLRRAYPDNEDYHVSHETIYRSLFIQARGALKKELLEHLRRTRGMRRSRHYTQKTGNHGRIRDAVSISERPATVEDRGVPGHWEVICFAVAGAADCDARRASTSAASDFPGTFYRWLDRSARWSTNTSKSSRVGPTHWCKAGDGYANVKPLDVRPRRPSPA
ncbi:hypothetical protein QFZ96_008204 [Paraburkholderia youngii]